MGWAPDISVIRYFFNILSVIKPIKRFYPSWKKPQKAWRIVLFKITILLRLSEVALPLLLNKLPFFSSLVDCDMSSSLPICVLWCGFFFGAIIGTHQVNLTQWDTGNRSLLLGYVYLVTKRSIPLIWLKKIYLSWGLLVPVKTAVLLVFEISITIIMEYLWWGVDYWQCMTEVRNCWCRCFCIIVDIHQEVKVKYRFHVIWDGR